MGVGPPGRTGRDQVAAVLAFHTEREWHAGDVVAIVCEHGAGHYAAALGQEGAAVYPVSCVGNLHTSVIELMLRGGAGGVLVLSCPPRDCRHREGPRWLNERLYQGREAELQTRVDRRRVRVAYAAAAERSVATRAIQKRG